MGCEHLHWEVQSQCPIDSGICLDCGRYESLSVLFNGLIKRTDEAVAKIEAVMKGEELYNAIMKLFELLETTSEIPDYISPDLYRKLHKLLGQIHPHLISWESISL